jgi:hypothetical protein
MTIGRPSSTSLEYWRLLLSTLLLALAVPLIVWTLIHDPGKALRQSAHL